MFLHDEYVPCSTSIVLRAHVYCTLCSIVNGLMRGLQGEIDEGKEGTYVME